MVSTDESAAMVTGQHDVEVGDDGPFLLLTTVRRHFSLTEGSPLLGNKKRRQHKRRLQNWTYCIGGGMFAFGTLLLCVPVDENDDATLGELSAWLYIVGSAAFLCMDMQSLFVTCRYEDEDDENTRIRMKNDVVSVIASLLYWIGSVGFLPENYSKTPLVGILGLWLASLLTVGSQIWKIERILTTLSGKKTGAPLHMQQRHELLVEAGTMVGGLGFLVGTSLFWKGLLGGKQMSLASSQNCEYVLTFWLLGSLGFIAGGYAAQHDVSAG